MSKEELMSLELNTVVKYGIFKSLLYKGKDEKYVHMMDCNGDEKKVYIDLFLKHATLSNPPKF